MPPRPGTARKDKTMYTDFLAARGYRRVTVERTEKQPGDLVLSSAGIDRVPEQPNVVALRRRKAGVL
jgi:hypothetical protein